MSSPELAATDRTRLRRLPQRARYERASLDAILDEALWCHMGFVADGQPFVIPTIHVRIADQLYVHGSAASRMLRTAASGLPVCVSVSLLDGLVLARSAFHHSMNYRSVVILGTAREVADAEEKDAALRAIVEHVAPGRSHDVRGPSPQELKATTVLRLPIEEASAKVRSGPPLDDEADYALGCWAGVLPLRLTPGEPLADPRLPEGVPVPEYVSRYRRPNGS